MKKLLIGMFILFGFAGVVLAQEYKAVDNQLEKTITKVIVTKQTLSNIKTDIATLDGQIASAGGEKAKYQAIIADIDNTIVGLVAAKKDKETELLKANDLGMTDDTETPAMAFTSMNRTDFDNAMAH